MSKVAVVLFNLGGPDSLEAVQPFLQNLFSDPAINCAWNEICGATPTMPSRGPFGGLEQLHGTLLAPDDVRRRNGIIPVEETRLGMNEFELRMGRDHLNKIFVSDSIFSEITVPLSMIKRMPIFSFVQFN